VEKIAIVNGPRKLEEVVNDAPSPVEDLEMGSCDDWLMNAV
jgi:hypothetical protein